MERARAVVEEWPEDGRVVGVVADPSDPAWTGRALLKLIRAVGERRRPAFLLDLAPEASNLTARFGAAGSDGFAEVADGNATLAGIAHRRPEIDGAYLPCGVSRSGEDLAGSKQLTALADRVRDAGGVLLVVLDRRAARRAADTGWPDGWLLVGDPESATGGEALPGDLPEVGRIEQQASDGRASGRWRRHRESGGFPTLKVVGALLLLAALAGAWWWYANRVTDEGAGGPAETGAADTVAAAPSRPADVRPASTGGAENAAAAEDAGSGDAASAADGSTLSYSVLIASYASSDDARERVRQLSGQVDGLYFVAPTPVQGALWHRVYAGSLPDRTSAMSLMERLVEAGAKEEGRAWDVRPVPWSFRLAGDFGRDFGDRSAAESWARRLRERGVPAYVLPVPDGDAYRVYSGAFEAREDAEALEARLREAGVDAELTRRTGEAP
ncbi:MAG: SPOR domain-containing protein [Candidatus Palauibacterales bacterium]|nr:SPOR domain-containing protein [Candidatus Palauibacterales bacterium]